MTQEAKEMKLKLRRFMFRILKKELANAFGLWDMWMEDLRRERERQMFQAQIDAKQARQLEAFAAKLQNAWLTKAWNHWFDLFVQLRKIKTTLGRIMHRKTAQAFDR